VLDFAIQVLRKGAAADDMISPFIVFSIQYIMVNHMNWKHKNYSIWKTTLKVFELVKSCIQVKPILSKLGGIIWQILLYDSSIHSVLWHILCTSTQLLEVSILIMQYIFLFNTFSVMNWLKFSAVVQQLL
jgi:nuclear pore complex protein Nup188